MPKINRGLKDHFQLEVRHRDIVIRLADWTDVSPKVGFGGWDVEFYANRVFCPDRSDNYDTLSKAIDRIRIELDIIEHKKAAEGVI